MTDTPDIAAMIAEIEKAAKGSTPAPWELCQHLKSKECDEACKCGYRGVVFGPDHDVAYAVFQPGHDPAPKGQEGSEPQRYPRTQEIANSHLMVAMRSAVPHLIDHIRALQERVAELEGAVGAYLERIDGQARADTDYVTTLMRKALTGAA
jgi:hypothetical protein